MSADEVAYWDAEAVDDPRYANANWGMHSLDDGAGTIKRITNIVADAIPHRFARILEIGCGPCRLLLPLAEQHYDVEFYGVDISPEMLWIAKQRIAKSRAVNIHVGHPVGDLMPRNMDVVYCVELMQHLHDGAALNVLSDAWGALKPGGRFVAQFVTRGEPGPHSFPRDEQQIRDLYSDSPWAPLTFVNRDDIHPDWVWVTTSKR